MLFMPYVLVMWRELGASDDESCTPEGDRVCSTYPSLGESAMEGRSVPSLLSADHCLLQSLFITWRHAAPSESGMKASISMGRMNSSILWRSCSWDHCRVKPFQAQHLHADLICVSIQKLPFKWLFEYSGKELLGDCRSWKSCSYCSVTKMSWKVSSATGIGEQQQGSLQAVAGEQRSRFSVNVCSRNLAKKAEDVQR